MLPKENIIYILEEHSNVSKDFSAMFWDKEAHKAKDRPTTFPYSVIFPLFNATDPYYWKHESGFKKTEQFMELTDKQIQEQAKSNIVTPIENILMNIINATPQLNR